MTIIEIKKLDNGSHRNQTIGSISKIPEGWAIIPDGMETPNFPFGDITTEKISEVETVTSWTPGLVPEVEDPDPEPTVGEILNTILGVSE